MEDKKFIVSLLNTHANAFVHFVNRQSKESFTKSFDSKWSVGQNTDHLIRSLSPVNQALLLPTFVIRLAFGKPNRTPRSYQQVVERYHEKLSAGGTASGRFIPQAAPWKQKDSLVEKFNQQTDMMIRRLDSWTEGQLNQYLLPHPLLGKLTIREMLFFSAYHIQHHLLLLEEREKTQ